MNRDRPQSAFYRTIRKTLSRLTPDFVKYIVEFYRYRVYITNAYSGQQKIMILNEIFRRCVLKRKKIFCHPEKPMPFCVIYKILMFLGIRIVNEPEKKCYLAIQYWHGFDGNPFSPVESLTPFKAAERYGAKVLNFHCNDISKTRVNSVFEEVFGYPISVDPRKHSGKCVVKSNWNALHKGQTIECPAEPCEGDFVYQKLICNETKDGLVEDMRVPVYGNRTPFVYLKYRSVTDRFVDRAHTNTKATMVEASQVLSKDELANIHRFCKEIGLDYGEVDVLRDKDDGRIYIVDANIAPSGPPSPISENEGKIAVMRLAQGFEEAFGL
jgi:hypothetical protein